MRVMIEKHVTYMGTGTYRNHHVCMISQCVCRIHVLSGAFSEEVAEGSDLWKQAESTYVTNLRVAADECAKVACNLYM